MQTGRKIKILRFDKGVEYKSDLFLQLFHNEGIERHFTMRETLQQNRMAENSTVHYWRRYMFVVQ